MDSNVMVDGGWYECIVMSWWMEGESGGGGRGGGWVRIMILYELMCPHWYIYI